MLFYRLSRTRLSYSLFTSGIKFSTAPSFPIIPDNQVDEKKLLRELCGKIRFTGPITVAEYMREVATNPIHGFYTNQKDALGAKGHFITSPEISQMFGECLAIWYLNEWMKMGEPQNFQIVELGPGKGTLMRDIMNTLEKLNPSLIKGLSIKLIEVSPRMRTLQKANLCDCSDENKDGSSDSRWGCPITWHDRLRDVPSCFSFFLANEFFDALPLNKYQRTAEGWREVLIDIDPKKNSEGLRWVISRHATPSCVLLDKQTNLDGVKNVELSPQSGLVIRELCQRIGEHGGAALVADYGDNSRDRDTLRAFRMHRQVDPLVY